MPSEAKKMALSVLGLGAGGGGVGLAADAAGTIAASRETTVTIAARRERKRLTGSSSKVTGTTVGRSGGAGQWAVLLQAAQCQVLADHDSAP